MSRRATGALAAAACTLLVAVAPGAGATTAPPLRPDPVVKWVQSPSLTPGQPCKPTTRLLVSSKPGPKKLPGGLTLRIWDTGPVKNPSQLMKAQRIVVVRIPAGAAAGATIITSPNLSTAQTPFTQIQHRGQVIAAVNGAEFDLRTLATPQGPQLVNNVIQKGTTALADTLNFDKYGRASAGRLKLVASGTVSVPVNGESVPTPLTISSLNTQILGSGVNIFTSAWGDQPHPTGSSELWLTGTVAQVGGTTTFNGTVASVHTSALGQPVPKPTGGQSTWVLTVQPQNAALLAAYSAGMPVSISLGYATTDRLGKPTKDTASAMGRGGVYVAAGQNRALCTLANEDIRPRTLIGWNSKTGDQFFVTIQGKYTKWGVRWGGATVHMAADYLLQLGADNAVALDGGGSTTMLVRTKVGATPMHIDRANPKDGMRPVVNVIAIVPMPPAPAPK